MTVQTKIDSNVSGMSYAEESSLGTLPGTPIWRVLEPNTEPDFGGNNTLVARNPISNDRQRKKGVVVDLEANCSFSSDLTYDNLQDIFQGFLFASFRQKAIVGGLGEITNVDGTGEDFEAASGLDAFAAGGTETPLVAALNFDNASNNGLHLVSSAAATSLTVTSNLVDEAAPPANAKVSLVGFQCVATDLSVDVTGDYPRIISAGGVDFTDYLTGEGGEYIYIGGDSAGLRFSNTANNGLKRVRSRTATQIEIDKSAATMVVEAGTGLTIQVFVCRTLKNELVPNIVRRSYNIERTLGAPDDASPSQIQSEYLVGQVPSELTVNFPQAEKVTCDLSFMGTNHEVRDGATGVKSGTRTTLVEKDAFNTAGDFKRFTISQVTDGDEAPTPLFAFVQSLTLNINNNVSGLNALGTTGKFELNVGQLAVSGSIEAYFADVAAMTAVRNNADITLDVLMVKDNQGIVVDLPLVSLGDGRAQVEQDTPIMLPLSTEAASGAQVDDNLDYTIQFSYFDYLPTLAVTVP